jgi:hypothetical protein
MSGNPSILTGCAEPVFGAAATCQTEPGALPVITNAVANVQEGADFSYQIEATNSPFSYWAIGLPPGLSLNTVTGLITGTTPNNIYAYSVILGAVNAFGAGTGSLKINVTAEGPPVVTSATISAGEGSNFSYQIQATNYPTSYRATNLPSGLSLNASTGLITGTVPNEINTYTIGLSATNAYGTGYGTLTLNTTGGTIYNLSNLQGLLWQLACQDENNPCGCPLTSSQSETVNATAGVTFTLTIRIRGVVEGRSYSNGELSPDGNWYIGGDNPPSNDDPNNWYRLTVTTPSQPTQVYFLNPYSEEPYCYGVDYQEAITVMNGSVISLDADSVDATQNQNQDGNGNPISVPDNDPTHPIQVSQPFNGQFAQFDVLSYSG